MIQTTQTIFQRLRARILARELKGIATYGESVDESTLDGLEELLDELIDAAIYTLKAIDQRDTMRGERTDMERKVI